MTLIWQRMESPVGALHLAERDGRICTLAFDDAWERESALLVRRSGDTLAPGQVAAVSVMRAYFSGELDAIDALEVRPHGTEFQLRVWAELRRVACGTTASYGDIARAIGQPSAVRAVGAANGQNPIAIVIPCHRIIGADGELTGYGGGLPRKRWLLQHEGAIARDLWSAAT